MRQRPPIQVTRDSRMDTSGDTRKPLAVETQHTLLQQLNEAVARNHGNGGGLLRIESLQHGLLWEGAAGEVERHGPMMTPSHAFEVASITKTFTAAVVMLLREAGLVDLDAPVAQYLERHLIHHLLVIDGHDYGPEITVRQLLNHTSGLPDYWSDGPFVHAKENEFLQVFEAHPHRLWEPIQLLHFARGLNAVGKPGRQFHYCDTGYTLLGLMIEQTAHQPLAQVLRERLFVPLKMNDTYVSYREQPPHLLVESHRFEATPRFS